MNKKKITIVTSLLPYPLTSGGAQAQYNFVDQLRDRYDISMIFPENGVNRIANMHALSKLWPEVIFYPYSYARQLRNTKFFRNKVKRAFDLKFRANSLAFKKERILKPYGCEIDRSFVSFVNNVLEKNQTDLLQVEFYPHLELVRHIKRPVKTVFVHHEIRYVRNKRMLAQLGLNAEEMPFFHHLKEEEIKALNCYDTVITLTDVDKKILMDDGVTTNVLTSPAAVSSCISDVQPWNNKFAFVGAASHGPNEEGMTWLAEEVLPLIDWTKYPKCEFDIVGKGWQSARMTFPKGLKVNALGFVANLSDVMCGSIMVVPILSGSGMRMKILEGSALGLPILTTTVGKEGLEFVPGQDCLVADDARDFAKALERLFLDEALRNELAERAQQVFRAHYSREKMAELRDTIYQHLLG